MSSARSILLLMVIGACGGPANYRYDYAAEPDPRKLEYVIGVADRLTIKVWKNPELSTDVVVRPDGTITMPLIGDLQAVGRTPSQLKDDIARQLSRFIRDETAVVTIAVTGINSYSYIVSGNVEKPGVYSAQKYVTILEAVQQAGGPNRYASPRKMQLIRTGPKGVVRIVPIDYPEILAGRNRQANLALMPGDQIFMP